MPGTSAVWPGYVAIARALGADADVAARLRLAAASIFNGSAPRDAEPNYLVLGTPSETEWWTFHNGGSTLTVMLHLWTNGPDFAECAQLYGEIHRVLNRSSLAVDGFGGITAECALVDIAGDPQADLAHGIARLELMGFRT
jgi:hypothetical protein